MISLIFRCSILLSILCFVACSAFKSSPKVPDKEKWLKLWEQVCPVSQGKGQIFLPKRTYAFSYESILNTDENFWAIALDVPFRGEETLIVPLKENDSLAGSLLQQVQMNPIILKIWKKNWAQLLQFLQQRESWSQEEWSVKRCSFSSGCQGQVGIMEWSFHEREIELKLKDQKSQSFFSWKFKRKNEELKFSEQIVTLRHQKNSQTISLHLYPASCGK